MSTIVQLAVAKERRHIFQQAQLYQSFGSVEIMDEHVKRHISRCSYLSPGTLRILNHLSGHSCKIPGVSFGRVAYIASETGLTERTVQIALKMVTEIIVPMKDDDEGRPYLMQLAGEVDQLITGEIAHGKRLGVGQGGELPLPLPLFPCWLCLLSSGFLF